MASRVLFQAILPRSTIATATFFAADIAGQVITANNEARASSTGGDGWDISRSFKTAAFGLGIVSWYGFTSSFVLSRFFPVSAAAGITLPTALLQAAAQQALFAPPLTFSFLYASSALIHEDENAFETAKSHMPAVGALAWSFLPWINAIANWGIKTPGLKMMAMNGIAFGWATYLTTVAASPRTSLVATSDKSEFETEFAPN
ncbi:hypothetical protein BJ741DRAFT_615388 [Chytriomyces cf. hyalinus JEL632]|nr:hypothetical protein BJ741DRAFT_615388 [Chytriomyces cf. hyalinus JEL632]